MVELFAELLPFIKYFLVESSIFFILSFVRIFYHGFLKLFELIDDSNKKSLKSTIREVIDEDD